MLQILLFRDAGKLTRGLKQSANRALLVGLFVVTMTQLVPRASALAEDDTKAAAGASASVDVLDRASSLQRAAQRAEELDQEAWKAISKDGDLDLAIMNMSEAAELARSVLGGDHWLTVLKESLAGGLKSVEKLPPAQKRLFIEASKSQSFAKFQWSQGNKQRALAQLRQAQDKRTEALGGDHVFAASFLLGLAGHECEAEDFREAKRHAADAVRILKTTWGDRNPGWAQALYYQALAENGLHEIEAAERHFREVTEILEPVAREGFSEFHMMIYSDAQLHVARLLNDQGRFGEAEPFSRRGSEILAFASRQVYGRFLESQVHVARSVSGQEKFAEAEIIFACLFKSLPANPPPDSLARIFTCYAEHLRRAHRDAEADQLEARIRKLSAQNAQPKSDNDTGSETAPSADAPAATRKK
jgi:hypothetical protein